MHCIRRYRKFYTSLTWIESLSLDATIGASPIFVSVQRRWRFCSDAQTVRVGKVLVALSLGAMYFLCWAASQLLLFLLVAICWVNTLALIWSVLLSMLTSLTQMRRKIFRAWYRLAQDLLVLVVTLFNCLCVFSRSNRASILGCWFIHDKPLCQNEIHTFCSGHDGSNCTLGDDVHTSNLTQMNNDYRVRGDNNKLWFLLWTKRYSVLGCNCVSAAVSRGLQIWCFGFLGHYAWQYGMKASFPWCGGKINGGMIDFWRFSMIWLEFWFLVNKWACGLGCLNISCKFSLGVG